MQPIFDFLELYVDFKLIVLIVLGSYWARKFLKKIFPKFDMAHKVLIFSTGLTIAYYYLLQRSGMFQENNLPSYFISYFMATSFYELAFKPMEKAVRKFLGYTEEEKS